MFASRYLVGSVLVITIAAVGAIAQPRSEDVREVPVTVTLNPLAEVGVRPIRVGDVASVMGANAALCKVVADLDLADPLGQRDHLLVSRTRVAFRIQLAGLPTGVVRVTGEDQVEVIPAHYQLTEAEVMSAARRAILKRLPSHGAEDIEVTLARPIYGPLNVAGMKDEVTLRAEVHAAGEPLGLTQVDEYVMVGGENRLSFSLHLDVRTFRKVAVAARKVEKGEALSESAVIFERHPVDGHRNYVTSPETLVGKKARQTLTAGTPLTTGDLEAMDDRTESPLVRQREPVKMIVHLAGVNVVASGEAMQDGRLGQLIRVRNVDSKQVVLGRVASRSVVELDP